jgi:hypothetical protein
MPTEVRNLSQCSLPIHFVTPTNCSDFYNVWDIIRALEQALGFYVYS